MLGILPRSVNALSGLYLISTMEMSSTFHLHRLSVNALSGLYLISTPGLPGWWVKKNGLCQCPLGLIPHFYGRDECVREGKRCRVNALSGLYLISTHTEFRDVNRAMDMVSMPSRAYTSFLQYPFKNLGFMRFPEPVFAGIYQNILTTAVFRAC